MLVFLQVKLELMALLVPSQDSSPVPSQDSSLENLALDSSLDSSPENLALLLAQQ